MCKPHCHIIVCGPPPQGTAERELSDLLHKALVSAVRLDTFPKAAVDVFALVLESGGGQPSDPPVLRQFQFCKPWPDCVPSPF